MTDNFDKRIFESVAKAWKDNAERLAEFVFKRLVNRSDVYGRYLALNNRKNSSARTVKKEVTVDLLKNHFQGKGRGDHLGDGSGGHCWTPTNQSTTKAASCLSPALATNRAAPRASMLRVDEIDAKCSLAWASMPVVPRPR